MLTLGEKVAMVPALLPMLLEGQPFIDAQDELSVLEFMRKYGMPERINDEIFIAMGKALDFIDPDKANWHFRLSSRVVAPIISRSVFEVGRRGGATATPPRAHRLASHRLSSSPSLCGSRTRLLPRCTSEEQTTTTYNPSLRSA